MQSASGWRDEDAVGVSCYMAESTVRLVIRRWRSPVELRPSWGRGSWIRALQTAAADGIVVAIFAFMHALSWLVLSVLVLAGLPVLPLSIQAAKWYASTRQAKVWHVVLITTVPAVLPWVAIAVLLVVAIVTGNFLN